MPAGPVPVVFVLSGLGEGGIERRAVTLAEEFLGRGHGVHVICQRGGSAFDLPAGLEVRPLGVRRSRHPFRFYERCARLLDGHLDGIFARDRSALVLTSSTFGHKTCVRSRHRGRIWFRHHGPWRPERKRFRPRRLKESHYAGLRHLAVSRDVAASVARGVGLDPGAVRVVPNPFDLEEIRRLGAGSCDAPSDPFLVHVARLDVEQKRHDLLLRAFRTSGVEGGLVLVGSGRDRERIGRMADELGLGERVVFAGFRKNPYPYLRRARASVLASDFEGLPGVAIESLALGTPVACTDTEGVRDIFPDRSSAFLAPPGDEEALARAIRDAWNAPPAPERLAALAEPFAVARVAEAYLGLADGADA